MTDFINNPQAEENKVLYRGFYSDDGRAVRVDAGIEEISENAFRDFLSIEELYLPKSLKRISACAFAGCKKSPTRCDEKRTS